jgi:hypothetical protein
MITHKKRVRNLDRYVPEEYRGKALRAGVPNSAEHRKRLEQIGFPPGPLAAGDAVLPAVIGPVTRFNAEGKQRVRRDLEMETAYRQVEWHWKEYHGDQHIERSDFRDVPYRRYPRELIPPASMELHVLENPEGARFVATSPIDHTEENRDLLTHAINLCLEIFGECHLVSPDLVPAVKTPIRHLNWTLLPPGKHPWDRLKGHLQPLLDRAKKGKRGVIARRLEIINEHEPGFTAVGRGGFGGYVVFGFPEKDLYVCESAWYGNATYVFDKDWEALSQLSKAQILHNDFQKDRIVHREGWEDAVRGLLR